MPNDLNIPSTITAADLLAAGLTQAEVAGVADVLAPDPAAPADATPPAAPAAPETPDDGPRVADAHYDPNEMQGTDGRSGNDIEVVDVENDLGEGDGIVVREYDPLRDEPPAPAAEAEPAPPAPAEDIAPLLELRRPAPPATARDFAAEEAAIRARLAEIKEQYDDGEMLQDDYDAQREAIVDSLADLRADLRVIERAAQPDVEAYRQGWFKLVNEHMAANPILQDDDEVRAGFDQLLRQVSADPSMQGLTAIQQIEFAHRRLGEAYLLARGEDMPDLVSVRKGGRAQPAKAPAAPAAPEAPKAAAPGAAPAEDGPRKEPRPPAPTTLAGVAGAQPGPMTGDPIVAEARALINSGNVLEAERLTARLSESQRRALLRS